MTGLRVPLFSSSSVQKIKDVDSWMVVVATAIEHREIVGFTLYYIKFGM